MSFHVFLEPRYWAYPGCPGFLKYQEYPESLELRVAREIQVPQGSQVVQVVLEENIATR